MIPTLLLAGFVVGLLPRRWAVASVLLMSMGWSAALLKDGVIAGMGDALGAAGLGLANAAVGALVGQATRAAIRMTREG